MTTAYKKLVFGVEDIGAIDERGNEHRTRNWLLTDEGFKAVEQGHLCINCAEPLREAFPERCPLCGFHVKRDQIELLNREHQGELDLGPSPAMKALDEEREREGWKARTGIWLPGDSI